MPDQSNTPTPREITLTAEREVRIAWSDGHVSLYPIQRFRDNCPCASCSGETDIFGETIMPLQLPVIEPGQYELKSLELVGNYAVAAKWGDGHDAGIYTWEYLLKLEQAAQK